MFPLAFLRDDELEQASTEDLELDVKGGDARGGAAAVAQSLAEILSWSHGEAHAEEAHDEPAALRDEASGAGPAATEAGLASAEPAATEAGAPGAQAEAPGAQAGAAPKAAHDWRDGARAYNSAHAALVEQFNAATDGACGTGAQVDPEAVARWQSEHGVSPDGRVGPRTARAAHHLHLARAARAVKEPKADASQADAAAPAKTDAKAPAKADAKAPAKTDAAKVPAKTDAATTTAKAPPPTTTKATTGGGHAAGTSSGPSPEPEPQLRGHYARILKKASLGQVGPADAVGELIAADQKLNGGASSLAGLLLIPFLLADLAKLALRALAGSGSAVASGGGAAAGGTSSADGKAIKDGPAAVGEPLARVIEAKVGGATQQCQVYVSPGGVTATPDIFLFFHGHRAQYNIDPKQRGKGEISGLDVAADAMSHARGKNTIAILPQGKLGGSRGEGPLSEEGGYMAALQKGLPAFLSSILGPLAAELSVPKLTPRHISIAGHSAGGYMGVHDALRKSGDLADAITDVTLLDTGYATSHFEDTAKWMYTGSPGKSVRIVGSAKQIESTHKHRGTFGKSALDASAKKHGCTTQAVSVAGDQRDADTKVVEHTRILKDGAVQCDVLIMMFDHFHNAVRDHAPLRDRVLDDAILSIGEGAAGNDTFGRRDQGEEPDESGLKDGPAVTTESAAKAHGSTASQEDHQKAADKVPPKKAKSSDKPKPKKAHAYDSTGGVDSFGNLTERGGDLRGKKSTATTFSKPFTVVRGGELYKENHKSLHKKLDKGTVVQVVDMKNDWVQITCADDKSPYTEADNVWVKFASLGGYGADVAFGNERNDPEDKARADKLREGLPEGRSPGNSKHKWTFSGHFMPSLDGVSLSGTLMSKVQALMEWAIHNDMVLGDIVIGSGMRSPKAAHYLCVRYEIANMDTNRKVTLDALKALPGGRDADGNKWYEAGWTEQQAIDNAKKLIKDAGASGKVAAAGYNPGDSRRAPLPLTGRPGVSNHCSGHAVDVDIPWRSADDPNKKDLWGWEQIYHQFGLTRPLHKDRGGKASTQESWHLEETGKALEEEPAP